MFLNSVMIKQILIILLAIIIIISKNTKHMPVCLYFSFEIKYRVYIIGAIFYHVINVTE